MNIFTNENISKYNTKPRYAGVGEYVRRNGVWAMDIRPEPFYKNYGEESYILRNEFISNTQYLIDLWIDADDVIYDGVYRACGLRLYYTDGTYDDSAVVTGASGRGFQHIQYVTNKSKSVRDFNVYYSTSISVYYRADSRIIPLSNTSSINKCGVTDSTEFTEYIDGLDNAKIGKGYILAKQLYEL